MFCFTALAGNLLQTSILAFNLDRALKCVLTRCLGGWANVLLFLVCVCVCVYIVCVCVCVKVHRWVNYESMLKECLVGRMAVKISTGTKGTHLSVNTHTPVCEHTHTHLSVNTHTHLSVNTHTHLSVETHTHLSRHTHTCL